jgi:Lrp/AsnC family transcriptional regulator for asnA, asnC and gidA
MQASFDDIDRNIISALQENAEATNRAIASKVGVSDVTVAGRIRRLTESKVIRPTIVYDTAALGLSIYCIAQIWVEGRGVNDVALALKEVPGLQTVVTMVGSPDITILFFARDHEHVDQVRRQVAAVPGIKTLDLILSLRLVKFHNSYGAYGMLMKDD